MTAQDLILSVTAILFMIITIIFTIRYCRLLALAQEEYKKAKDVISGIVLMFKRRSDKQDETINFLTLQTEAIHSTIERFPSRLQLVENKMKDLTSTVESRFTIQKEVINSIDGLKKEVGTISETQQNLEKQLGDLKENLQSLSKEERTVSTTKENQSFSKLTETERVILEFLRSEGSKSAPEVEEKIGKTREHTARLMKKLWREGYIERDTHRIPYVYRITENLEKMEIKDLNHL